jgi:hypothetical protein
MIANLLVSHHNPIACCPQHAAGIAFWLARIGLGFSAPVDASQGVTAAGFDHGVTIASGVEARTEADVQRKIHRERRGGGFEEARVYHNDKRQGRNQDIRIRVHEHGDLPGIQAPLDPIGICPMSGHALHSMLPFVNRFRKRDCPPDGQRLGKLGNHDLHLCALQA